MVLSSAGETKTSAYRNSFHDSVNANSAAQITPGTATGSRMRSMVCARPQPSSIAHSSISRGTVRKYPMRSHVQNGTRNVGYVTTSDHRLSASPSRVTTVVSGRKSSEGGTREGTKIATPKESP